MPQPSSEPEYPVHPALARIVAGWEAKCPGVFQAVSETIGAGNWDAQKGLDVPPFSLEGEFRVAAECLADQLLKAEQASAIRKGPLLVRLGLSKPSDVLSRGALDVAQEGWRQVTETYQGLAPEMKTNAYSTPTSLWNWSSGPMKLTA